MFWTDAAERDTVGMVFNIEHYHVHDGSGIRTNVFLKGCNLWCPWCCNPESQACDSQMAIHKNLCTGCGCCCRPEICPAGASTLTEVGGIAFDSGKCVLCGRCVEKCPNAAREIYGSRMSVAEVISEVEKDTAYYDESGGGLTITGGEPCMQPEFSKELAMAAHRRFIEVAIETAGAVPFETLWTVAEHADEILMDLKFTNEEDFAAISGVPLSTVLGNFRELKARGKNVVMRCPIIPTFNDTEEHIDNLIRYAKEFDINEVDLLPFHQLGKYKYDSLDHDYKLRELSDMDRDRVEMFRDRMSENGINAVIRV